MLILQRTHGKNADFQYLIGLLNQSLWSSEYADQSTYDTFNIVDNLETVLVAYFNHEAVGCGCFRKFDDQTVEIKRMFVKPTHRKQGIAYKIVDELEHWATELGYENSLLETGILQTEAMNLYQKAGYRPIPNYGVYKAMKDSVCFGKNLMK